MFKFIVVLACVAVTLSQHPDDSHAEIKYLNTDINEHGFDYSFETTNNIQTAARGDEHGNIQGGFGWVSPEGEHVVIQYVADENGYQPSGDVIPTPPPIPEAILKALEYIRTHPPRDDHHGH